MSITNTRGTSRGWVPPQGLFDPVSEISTQDSKSEMEQQISTFTNDPYVSDRPVAVSGGWQNGIGYQIYRYISIEVNLKSQSRIVRSSALYLQIGELAFLRLGRARFRSSIACLPAARCLFFRRSDLSPLDTRLAGL